MISEIELQAPVIDGLRRGLSVRHVEEGDSTANGAVTLELAVSRQLERNKAGGPAHRARGIDDLIVPVTHNALREIRSMREVLGTSASAIDFANLEQSVGASLARIEHLMRERKTNPLVQVRHSVESGFFPCEPRELRLGIFPTAANPIHWAHLLGGLVAMDRFHLDKVIFVIAGDHSKVEMASEDARHSMAKQVLALFHPLFEYSSIARGTIVSGEENLFKTLGLNPTQAIHAFYIAGGDHYHRIDPASRLPDTIQKLEDGIISRLHGFNERLHRVSAVFLDRKSEERDIPTLLDVRRVGKLAVQTSSTAIRMALEDQRRRRDLYTLPFTGLASICHNNLYHVRRAGKLRALHRVP